MLGISKNEEISRCKSFILPRMVTNRARRAANRHEVERLKETSLAPRRTLRLQEDIVCIQAPFCLNDQSLSIP